MATMGVVAVTGATGFVGTACIKRLLEAGWQVRALTRRQQDPIDGVAWVNGSLEDKASLFTLCDGANAVLHIAGVVNAPDAAGFEAGNVTGTANIIAAAKEAGVNRFLHVSSLSARRPDLSQYGASKNRGEKLVATSLLDWTIIRPPGVYGPGDTELLDVFKLAKRGLAVLPPRGKVAWIHVDDLARLLTALLPAHEDATTQIYEADDGQPDGWTHSSFARAIGWALGKRVTALHLPKAILFAAAHLDRTFRRSKAKLTPDRAGYIAHRDWRIDRKLLPPAVLWTPRIKTREGLKDTARWYERQGWL
jgi:nucleoside-diphosphate-sugar epimerase